MSFVYLDSTSTIHSIIINLEKPPERMVSFLVFLQFFLYYLPLLIDFYVIRYSSSYCGGTFMTTYSCEIFLRFQKRTRKDTPRTRDSTDEKDIRTLHSWYSRCREQRYQNPCTRCIDRLTEDSVGNIPISSWWWEIWKCAYRDPRLRSLSEKSVSLSREISRDRP